MKPLRRLLSAVKINTSIRRRITASYLVIIFVMLVPAAASITLLSQQSTRYDQLITSVSDANELNRIVKTRISDEIWEIVSGKITFAAGSQYEIIADINDRLDLLMSISPDLRVRNQLVLAQRSMSTLAGYVDILGDQINRQAPVSDQMATLEEIRGVSALVQDVLQEYIVLEIEAAARTNERMIATTRVTILVGVMIVLAVAVFSLFAQASVSRRIRKPLESLQQLALKIADGDLDARAQISDVEELRDLTNSLNRMAGKIKSLIAQNIQKQKNLQKSEMKALQAQITPHFLYNTLDAIVWMAEANRKEEVVEITQALSGFFRISLSKGRDWITVAEEVEHVRSYLTIQQIRYRDILDYRIDVENVLVERSILKLLLQPLVENALYHGIKGRRGKGMILVSGWQELEWMCFCVEDNGIGMDETRLSEIRRMLESEDPPETDVSGYGLYNVNKRLKLYYGPACGLLMESNPESGTQVLFKVPFDETLSGSGQEAERHA